MEQSRIDPVCGMTGKIKAHNLWFCSVYCVRKYESEKGLEALTDESLCTIEAKTPLYKNKLFLTAAFLAVLIFLSFFIPQLHIFRHHFIGYFKMVWMPLLMGFLIGGLIEVYVPRSYIIKILSRKSPWTILNASALGFIFSGCSHGCLAIAFELYKKGASVPAVISFLLASPWANISITLLLFSFFGVKALLIILSAILISIVTGLIFIYLDKKGLIEKNMYGKEEESGGNFSIWNDIKARSKRFEFNFQKIVREDGLKVLKGSWHLAQMVLWWILIGISLSSLIGGYLPPEIFQRWMGKGWTGLSVTLAGATLIEICSEGSSPLAFEIYRQTGAFGNAFVFLMAGVITDYTEIGLLWSNVGRRTALWLPAISVPLTLILGFLFNLI